MPLVGDPGSLIQNLLDSQMEVTYSSSLFSGDEMGKAGRPNVYLVVTIDTEEDQWGLTGEEATVRNISHIPRLQSLFDRYGIIPTYLVSFPVAKNDKAMSSLRSILNDGRCEIGCHLHPWNTPPIKGAITNKSTMLSNLPYELQLAKITHLTEAIAHQTGRPPTSFRAGRWGLGKDTLHALISCNYKVDSSITPFVSWESYEGPSFKSVPVVPFIVRGSQEITSSNGKHSILELPVTIGYNRAPFEKSHHLENRLGGLPSWLHARGLAKRLGILKKIWLSPETEDAEKMLVLSRALIKHGGRVLNMTFHSNSLIPGFTPFVTSQNQLKIFYDRLEAYFDGLNSLANIKSVCMSRMADIIEDGETASGTAAKE